MSIGGTNYQSNAKWTVMVSASSREAVQQGLSPPINMTSSIGETCVDLQLCCDADRKVTSLSMLSPGAVPDTLAWTKNGLLGQYRPQHTGGNR